MNPAPAKKRGRPRIEGKRKYTLNLTEKLVSDLYKTVPNLSGFVDEQMQKHLQRAK